MRIFSSTPQDHEGYTVHKFQLAGKWSESEKISCHAILKNLYEPKMDVILTISFKVTAEIEIRKHVLHRTSQTRCIGFLKPKCFLFLLLLLLFF